MKGKVGFSESGDKKQTEPPPGYLAVRVDSEKV